MTLKLRPAEECRFDLVALGEVMLRLDPGEGRVRTARRLRGLGGRRRVQRRARPAARCFGLRAACGDRRSPTTRSAGWSRTSCCRAAWTPRHVQLGAVRRHRSHGPQRPELHRARIRGARRGRACPTAASTAVSQLQAGDIDWDRLFGDLGVRWLHTGGIFAGLSASTPDVVIEAMDTARRHGTVVSYDLNYRPSLWTAVGGKQRAQEVNRSIAPLVDVDDRQ